MLRQGHAAAKRGGHGRCARRPDTSHRGAMLISRPRTISARPQSLPLGLAILSQRRRQRGFRLRCGHDRRVCSANIVLFGLLATMWWRGFQGSAVGRRRRAARHIARQEIAIEAVDPLVCLAGSTDFSMGNPLRAPVPRAERRQRATFHLICETIHSVYHVPRASLKDGGRTLLARIGWGDGPWQLYGTGLRAPSNRQ
jgi:hypothetical protein